MTVPANTNVYLPILTYTHVYLPILTDTSVYLPIPMYTSSKSLSLNPTYRNTLNRIYEGKK